MAVREEPPVWVLPTQGVVHRWAQQALAGGGWMQQAVAEWGLAQQVLDEWRRRTPWAEWAVSQKAQALALQQIIWKYKIHM